MLKALVDNDIVEKLSRWEAADYMGRALDVDQSNIGYLETLRFVVGKRIERNGSCRAKQQLLAFLDEASAIDATDQEVALAAEIEEVAVKCELDMDTGESLLISVALVRGVAKLATGDKRAVCSCSPLARTVEDIVRLKGALISLEQILARLLAHIDSEDLRSRVCGAPCDRTASIAFGCSAVSAAKGEAILSALESYQRDLATRSEGYTNPNLLV